MARPRRWSNDAWFVLRERGSQLFISGAALPVYGGSQAGAVIRFDFAPAAQSHPSAYVRAVQALGGEREGDLAAGFALRPLAGVPATAQAELRATRRHGAVEARPAAFVTTGVDDAPIAGAITVRGYAQAGYVGGRDATAFADGSLVAERTVWSERDRSIAAGVGAWGGAQRGVARLDFGPTASMKFRLGDGAGRIAVDYRVRVAGNAEPAASAALTLSAGF